jgi:hypothetical protein
MSRIDIDMIKQAYEKTGLKPVRGSHNIYNNESLIYATGLLALYAHINNNINPDLSDAIKWGFNEYGEGYTMGFLWGFYGNEEKRKEFEAVNEAKAIDQFNQGWNDGFESWKAVKGCGLAKNLNRDEVAIEMYGHIVKEVLDNDYEFIFVKSMKPGESYNIGDNCREGYEWEWEEGYIRTIATWGFNTDDYFTELCMKLDRAVLYQQYNLESEVVIIVEGKVVLVIDKEGY